MALARQKAEGRGDCHWKRNDLFNSNAGSRRRLPDVTWRVWPVLASGSGASPCCPQTRTAQQSDVTSPFSGESTEEPRWPDDLGCCSRLGPHVVTNTYYIVSEISFVTRSPFFIPGGWFGVIDQGFRQGINKDFTSPLARAKGLSEGPPWCPIIP